MTQDGAVYGQASYQTLQRRNAGGKFDTPLQQKQQIETAPTVG